MENATCVRHCILASWCPRPFFVLASPLPHTLVPFQWNRSRLVPSSSSSLSSYSLCFLLPAFSLTSVVRLFPVVSRSCIIRPVNDPPVLPSLPVPACLPLFSSIQVYIHAYTYICNVYIYIYICIYIHAFSSFHTIIFLYTVYILSILHIFLQTPRCPS